MKNLTEKLLSWTGERWIISLSKNNNAKSIYEKNLEGKNNEHLDEKLHHSSDDRIFEPNPLVEATKYRASTNYNPKSSSEIRKRTNRGSASWDENVVTSSPKTRSHLLPSASLPSNGLDD